MKTCLQNITLIQLKRKSPNVSSVYGRVSKIENLATTRVLSQTDNVLIVSDGTIEKYGRE